MSGGTKFDLGKEDLSLNPPAGLRGAARVFAFGASKYGRYNFMGGFKASRLIAACLRHLNAWMWESENDIESGESHLFHAICCLLMLAQIKEHGTMEDDRFKPVSQIKSAELTADDMAALAQLEADTRHLTVEVNHAILKSAK